MGDRRLGCPRRYDATALRAVAPTGVIIVQYDVASGDAFGTSMSAIVRHTLATAPTARSLS